MTSDQPLVSFGVPVYNDAPWLRNALDHLLGQDYKNLEIVLADDGSIDGSRDICRQYALRDGRIRLFENKHNLGTLGNHKFVFDVSSGDYFAWASGHDYYEPFFVSRTLEKLLSNPSMIMCCGGAMVETSSGKLLQTVKGGYDTRGLKPVKRFAHLKLHHRPGGGKHDFYGLYRAEYLAQATSFTIDCAGNDIIMIGELSLLGDIYKMDEILYHRVEAWEPPAVKDKTKVWFERLGINQESGKKLIPFLNMINEYLRMIDNSKVTSSEKEALCAEVGNIIEQYYSTIEEEIEQFITFSRAELSALERQGIFRRYRASRVLSTLEHAWSIGFDSEDMHRLRTTCLAGIGLEAGAMTPVEKAKVIQLKLIQRRFNAFRQTVSSSLHKMLGERVWGFMRWIFYRSHK